VLGCGIPEAWGGTGLDAVAYAVALEELASVSAATAAIVATHASLAAWPILAFGNDAQRARFLPGLARGDRLGGWALPETTDADSAPPIIATWDAENYILNGRCASVLNGSDANVVIVFAALESNAATDFFRAFIVETDQAGWRPEPVERIGLHGAPATDVTLTHVRVPRAHRLGVDSAGRGIARRTLETARIAAAAQSVGVARAAVDDALGYARERRAFGQALADFQGIQWRLADMATAVEAARLLTLEAAFLLDVGQPAANEATMARLLATDTAMQLATQAVQVHGGYGYTREFAVERYFRDAATLAVPADTAERERLAIAERLLRGAAS
jgi:alkylation response protein AidB-like acyl-CoA dehydrogenase